MTRHHHLSSTFPRFRIFLIFLIVCGIIGFFLPTSVSAAIASHHAGHTWNGDGTSFLGSYRLTDNTIAFCVDQPSGPPVGIDYSSPNYSVGIADEDNHARLAYLMRQWGNTSDPTVAAAVALNVWRITGMNGKSDSYYAARANEAQHNVLENADAQRAEAGANASRGVSAHAELAVPTDGSAGTFQVDLTVDKLGGFEKLPPGTHTGVATLTGGTFAETGNASANVANATTYHVIPDSHSVISLSIEVSFDALPYGGSIGVLVPSDPSRQRLVTTSPATITAQTHADSGPPTASRLPFQITAQTQTSTSIAKPDTEITDHIKVSVEPTPENPRAEWGMQPSPNGPTPVSVPIFSTLWGPFTDPIKETPTVPDNAPQVCEVTTTVSAVGEYETEPCIVPAPGFYVWTERIPKSVFDKGATVLPWVGAFGVTNETTLVRWEPSVTTQTSHSKAPPGICLSDTIVITGSRPGYELPFTARLWGPFPERPLVGTHIDPISPEVNNVTISPQGDGEFSTPCIVVNEDGFYVWTHESIGTHAIRPFTSLEIFAAETTYIRPEDNTVPTPVPPPSTKEELPTTGVDANHTKTLILTALGVIAIGVLIGVVGIVVRIKRRKLVP